jgi:hypothetical protein
MQQTEAQFILMDVPAFSQWLMQQNIRREIQVIQNHHTWKPNYHSFTGENHFRLLQGMKASHLKRNFSDIAQNITTFPDGTIAVCRPLEEAPAGIYGANKYGICIEHIGDFDHGGDQMNPNHSNSIVALNAILCNKFKLTPNTDSIVYHHWYDLKTGKRRNGEGITKSCPGTNFFGGNKPMDAQTYFIPLVIDQLKSPHNQKQNVIVNNEIKEEPQITKKKYGIIQIPKLNVRKGPGTQYSKLRYLLKDEMVPLQEKRKDWYRISASNEWIAAQFLRETEI